MASNLISRASWRNGKQLKLLNTFKINNNLPYSSVIVKVQAEDYSTSPRMLCKSTSILYTIDKEIAKPDILMSEQCVAKLKDLLNSEDGSFLRVIVEGGGCSGFQYKFDIDKNLNEDDRVFERDNVKVVTDETSLEYIRGSTIDYHQELIRSAFRVINNPIAETGCSCGVSFSIKI